MSHVIEQRQVENAISEALRIGDKWPRRWLAGYGGLPLCRGDGAKELNKAYRQHRKRIQASIEPIIVSAEWL